MRYSISATAACAALALSAAAAHAETRTPDKQCVSGEPSITVEVTGFKSSTGMVRAQLYGPGGRDFLGKGAWAMRIEKRRASDGPMRFCFPVDRPGQYAVAVRHDANDNDHSDWNDGGAFTRNPDISLLHLKPDFKDTSVTVGTRPVAERIVMQYRHGLSVGPLKR